jgi:hypothetical protein
MTRPSAPSATGITFTVADLERIWRLDSSSPAAPQGLPQTSIVVRRNSPHDLRNDQLRVSIDERLLATLRYGELAAQIVEPGIHTVRLSSTLFTRTLVVDAERGRDLHVQCGTGMRRAQWLARMLPRLSGLGLWLVLESNP